MAKPLHVGHLRSAIIGESLKRIYRYFGNDVTGDIHMGDWGLQMGLIIAELRCRQPELPYFDESFTGDYRQRPPSPSLSWRKSIPPPRPRASRMLPCAEAHAATAKLQQGDRGCRALWAHIMRVSVADLKKNYGNLNVSFDIWLGESDAQSYIPPMIEQMKRLGLAEESEGALVVPVAMPEDTKEVPPASSSSPTARRFTPQRTWRP